MLALAFNALVWGVSWWPMRYLQSAGVHPLWATAMIFIASTVMVALWRPSAVGQVLRTPALWVLVLAAGTTNAAFNWGVAIGDVVRVVLLFYLMPLWAVVLARWLLGEALTPLAGLRVLLALAGAAVVLWPVHEVSGPWWQALPLPRTFADWLGVLGGFTFALNNVMLKREAHRSQESRAMAMFAGGVLVSGVLALAASLQGTVAWPPAAGVHWLWPVAALSLVFLSSNLALQYGAARLPSNVTSVVMLSEVVFAAVSAALLGAGEITPAVLAGGALILAAAVLSTAGGTTQSVKARRADG